MGIKQEKISDRLLDFGVNIVKIALEVNKNIIGKTVPQSVITAKNNR